jgi:hypothetical protein
MNLLMNVHFSMQAIISDASFEFFLTFHSVRQGEYKTHFVDTGLGLLSFMCFPQRQKQSLQRIAVFIFYCLFLNETVMMVISLQNLLHC